jgi:GNAT superfamily N-acetyltransferase
VDKPGFLAVLAASLALRSVNILSVGVHVTEAGAVDDFLVDAPDELTEQQLRAAVERGRGRDVWVARAEAQSLVDAPTRALDLATYLVRNPGPAGGATGAGSHAGAALAELLEARASWLAAAGPDDLGISGAQMWVPAPGGGAWLVERAAPDFTPAEYARAQALLAVASARSRVASDAVGLAAAGAGPRETLLLPDGRELTLRRGGAADLAAVRAMHDRCSPETLLQRYLAGASAPSDPQLARLLVPARGCSLLVVADQVVGVASLIGEGVQAELALLVEDAWQRRGIGTALLRRAVTIATDGGFDALVVHAQAQNPAIPRTLRRLAAGRHTDRDGDLVTVTVPLRGTALPAARAAMA